MHVVVVTGGDPPPAALRDRLATPACVIAADSGLAHARQLGWRVDAVVGDLDSATADDVAWAEQQGAVIERHPAEKDATDFELALDAAVARGAQHITVVGGHGGRLDHFLANALSLAAERLSEVSIEAWIGVAHVVVVRDTAALSGRPGSFVTLLPLGGPARGITTSGLRYPLVDEDLAPGTSRGVSNELVDTDATVMLRAGVLLAIQPGALSEEDGSTDA